MSCFVNHGDDFNFRFITSSRYNSFCIMTRLRALLTGFDSRLGHVFSFLHRGFQNGPGCYSVSYLVGTEGFFPL